MTGTMNAMPWSFDRRACALMMKPPTAPAIGPAGDKPVHTSCRQTNVEHDTCPPIPHTIGPDTASTGRPGTASVRVNRRRVRDLLTVVA